MSDIIVCIIAVVIAGLRISGVGQTPSLLDQSFKDAAHLFAGGMFAIWLYSRRLKPAPENRWIYLGVGIALSVVEVACFVYFKVKP